LLKRLGASLKHPHFPVYVVSLWVFWLVFQVFPDQSSAEGGSLLVLSLLALIVYAIPLALILVMVTTRR
jgi:hypothetical protein